MTATTYHVNVTLTRQIPNDILLEHLAVGLRSLGDTRVLGAKVKRRWQEEGHRAFSEPRGQRTHPFDGPEVFDDEVPERLPITGDFWNALTADFPHLTQFFAHKGRTVASPPRDEPAAEGDWALDGGDRVGEDV